MQVSHIFFQPKNLHKREITQMTSIRAVKETSIKRSKEMRNDPFDQFKEKNIIINIRKPKKKIYRKEDQEHLTVHFEVDSWRFINGFPLFVVPVIFFHFLLKTSKANTFFYFPLQERGKRKGCRTW